MVFWVVVVVDVCVVAVAGGLILAAIDCIRFTRSTPTPDPGTTVACGADRDKGQVRVIGLYRACSRSEVARSDPAERKWEY